MNLRILTIVACLIFATQLCRGQSDTLQVSSAYTTHLIFSSDITYADLSNPQDIAAKIIVRNPDHGRPVNPFKIPLKRYSFTY